MFLIGLRQEKQMTKPLKSWDSRLSVCLRLSLTSRLVLWSCTPTSWLSRQGSRSLQLNGKKAVGKTFSLATVTTGSSCRLFSPFFSPPSSPPQSLESQCQVLGRAQDKAAGTAVPGLWVGPIHLFPCLSCETEEGHLHGGQAQSRWSDMGGQ